MLIRDHNKVNGIKRNFDNRGLPGTCWRLDSGFLD